MKRVLLLLATNVAVMLVLSIVVSVLGVDRWLTANGIDYASLLVVVRRLRLRRRFHFAPDVQSHGQDGRPVPA